MATRDEKRQVRNALESRDKQQAKARKARGEQERGKAADKRRWHAIEDEHESARCMVSTAKRLYDHQGRRREAAKRNLSAYLGRDVNLASPRDLYDAIEQERLPILQGIVDTAKAQMCRSRPKPVALTKGSDYYERQEAKKATKFCEAQNWQPSGRYANGWEMGEACVKDAAIWGDGFTKVYADVDRGQITEERVFVHDLYVGDSDSLYGQPKQLFHIYQYDRANLAERFADCEAAIMRAPMAWDVSKRSLDEDDDQVTVVECWRLPHWKDGKPVGGRHMLAIPGSGNVCLAEEPWEYDIYPFASIHWEPESYGFWSSGLVQAVAALQDDINEFLDYMLENTKLGGFGFMEYQEGDYNEEQLRSNMPLRLVKRNAGAKGPPVQVKTPPPFSSAVIDVWSLVRSAFFETTGVSDMATQGRKEQGVTSGVAIRTVNDLQDQRFLPKARSWEQYFCTKARLALMAAEQLQAAGKSPKLALVREGYVDELDFSGIKLPLDRAIITVQAQNSSQDSMAGRRQAVIDMLEAGWITNEQAEEMIASANPDVEAFTSRQLAQRRYYEKLAASFQSAHPKSFKPFTDFEMPDPMLDIKMGIGMMTDGYAEAKAEGAPQFNLELFRNWIVFGWMTLQKGAPLQYSEETGMAMTPDQTTDQQSLPEQGLAPAPGEMMPGAAMPPQMSPTLQ